MRLFVLLSATRTAQFRLVALRCWPCVLHRVLYIGAQQQTYKREVILVSIAVGQDGSCHLLPFSPPSHFRGTASLFSRRPNRNPTSKPNFWPSFRLISVVLDGSDFAPHVKRKCALAPSQLGADEPVCLGCLFRWLFLPPATRTQSSLFSFFLLFCCHLCSRRFLTCRGRRRRWAPPGIYMVRCKSAIDMSRAPPETRKPSPKWAIFVVVMTSQMFRRNRSKCQPFFSFCWVRHKCWSPDRHVCPCEPADI